MLLNEMLLEDAQWWLADDVTGLWIETEAQHVCTRLYREWACDWTYLGEEAVSWLALLIREAIK